jgi:lipoprotein-anchoring transpeptidase ErfK/SrfK
MHVTKQYHYLVVTVLGAIILVLLIVLFWFASTGEVALNETRESTETSATSTFLQEEEILIISSDNSANSTQTEVLPVEQVLFEYVEVTAGCDIHFEGECLNVRSGPGTEYPVVEQLRNDIVLKVGGKIERAGQTWYKIIFDEVLRYPERVTSDWYVAADFVEVLYDEGDKTIWDKATTSERAAKLQSIIVDRSEQKLYAYEDDVLFMEADISTGLALTPTPRGEFAIFKKTPSRYMQGPLPGLPADQYYDLPGVPWNLYFTNGGAVIHGAYWHNSFGSTYSHGCVNLLPSQARKLYNWAHLGTRVIVRD